MLTIPNFTLSGYGDRMNDLLCLISYARAKRIGLYVRWEDFPGMPDFQDIPSWRFQDTALKNFLEFFRLPDNVVLSYNHNPFPTEVCKYYLGGAKSPEVFYRDVVSKEMSLTSEEWNTIVSEVKSELGFKVSRYVPSEPYAVVHLRRTDKLRGVCETQVVKDELALLNAETFSAIRTAVKSGITQFYIATDDPTSKPEYIEYITSLGGSVIEPTNVHNLLASYYDTWMMRSSSLIIASMRYSTFSLFPSLWWNIPLWTVLDDSLHFKYEFNHHAPVTYYKNVQLDN